MNNISTILMLLIALSVAILVGLFVVAPEGMIQNPPGGLLVPIEIP